jgi:hypothetical protein
MLSSSKHDDVERYQPTHFGKLRKWSSCEKPGDATPFGTNCFT